MSPSIPETKVRTALSRNELDKLLLGEPQYQYRSRFSPAPGKTDLAELLAAMIEKLDAPTYARARTALVAALHKLSATYDGIEPVASAILFESVRQSLGKPILGLPLNELARELIATINLYKDALRQDRAGAGAQWPDGKLGEIRLLSKNTEKYGGPAFCQ